MANDNDSSVRSLHAASPLPPLLSRILDTLKQHVIPQFEEVFTTTDDLLFDLATKAHDNDNQNDYFDAMRLLRRKKAPFEVAFLKDIERAFHSPADPIAVIDKISDSQGTKASNLSLIDNEQLERKIAITNIVAKGRALYPSELVALATRLSELYPGKSITQMNNPLDPGQICQSFYTATQVLGIDIRSQVVFFKQFDRIIIKEIGYFYDAANALLVEAGILPEVPYTISKNRDVKPRPEKTTKATGSADANESGDGGGTGNQALLQELRDLLQSVKANDTAARNLQTLNGPALQQTELVSLVSGLDPHTELDEELSAGQPLSVAPLINFREQLFQLLSTRAASGEVNSVANGDSDALHLVELLFSFILDDENLPVPVQALLSRLQIPVLKLALKDASVFNRDDHPARLLINRIASAAIGWPEDIEAEDRFYKQVATIVKKIRHDDTESIAIYEKLLADFEQFMAKAKRQQSLIEKRSCQEAVGQAHFERVQYQIAHSYQELMQSARMPQMLIELLNSQWFQYLQMVYLRKGEESEEAQTAWQFVRDLKWSLEEHQDPRSLQRLENISQRLQNQLEAGLLETSVIHSDIERWKSIIAALHEQIVAGQFTQLAVDFVPYTAPDAIQHGASETIDEEPLEDLPTDRKLTAVERQKRLEKERRLNSLKQVNALEVGSWLEFNNRKSRNKKRCKVAAKIAANDSLVLVNRRGAKVATIKRETLAYGIDRGNICLLDSGQLFDRAMHSITTHLRSLMPESAT